MYTLSIYIDRTKQAARDFETYAAAVKAMETEINTGIYPGGTMLKITSVYGIEKQFTIKKGVKT